MSLDALALKNVCVWREFQSRLLFITNLLLEHFLTALYNCYLHLTIPCNIEYLLVSLSMLGSNHSIRLVTFKAKLF